MMAGQLPSTCETLVHWLPPTIEQQHIEGVCASLGQSWHFLAGQERTFEWMQHPQTPEYAPYSYFLAFEIAAQHRIAGVGVLVEPADALAVASHMFGQAPETLQESDLRDACSEACNILSDSIAVHISGDADMTIGLPYAVSLDEYVKTSTHSTASAIYCSHTPQAKLHVIVFHTLHNAKLP